MNKKDFIIQLLNKSNYEIDEDLVKLMLEAYDAGFTASEAAEYSRKYPYGVETWDSW